MLLDLSESPQTYIEDCEVCCRPIKIAYASVGAELASFDADTIEQ